MNARNQAVARAVPLLILLFATVACKAPYAPTTATPPAATAVPPTAPPTPAPAEVNIALPASDVKVGFEQEIVRVVALVTDAAGRPAAGATVEAVITSPDGQACAADTLDETSPGKYDGELCSLPGADTVAGTYTVTVTVSGPYEGGQVSSFDVEGLRVVEKLGFRLVMPQDFLYGSAAEDYARSQGDKTLELLSSAQDSLLIYRKTDPLPLEVEPMTLLLTDLNLAAYGMQTFVEVSEQTEFDGRPALRLTGRWDHDFYGVGPFTAVGFHCGGRFFIIEAAVKGPLSPDLLNILDSFHCLEE